MRRKRIKLYDKVRIKKTGEIAFVVDAKKGIYMLEIDGANEMPHFYDRDDFEKVEE